MAGGHTHGAYEEGYINDDFSQADKNFAEIWEKPEYLATPIGYLKKYNPKTQEVTIVNKKLPYDKNHPDRKKKK